MKTEKILRALHQFARGFGWPESSIPKTSRNEYDWDGLIEIYNQSRDYNYVIDITDEYSDVPMFI